MKKGLNEICLPQPLINYQLCIFILTLTIIINATFFDFKKHFFYMLHLFHNFKFDIFATFYAS